MTLDVRVRQLDDVLEISTSGVIDQAAARAIDEAVCALAQRDQLVLINLDDAIVIDRNGVESLAQRLARNVAPSDVGLVCRRPSAAQLLRRWRISRIVPVYRSFDAALHRESVFPEVRETRPPVPQQGISSTRCSTHLVSEKHSIVPPSPRAAG